MLTQYIKEKGLSVKLMCQELHITRQAFEQYGKTYDPTLKTLKRIANAMTELGVPTTVAELYEVLAKREAV